MSSDIQVVITDCDHADINEETKVLQAAGISFRLCQCRTAADLAEQCQGAVVAINQYAPFTEEVFAALPDLKAVVRYGVGVDNIDLAAATRHQVQVCNVPDYGTLEVADHAFALLMELTRHAARAAAQVKSGIWDYTRVAPIRRLSELTVGIVGLGRIGCAFAKKVKALGCHVIGCDVYTAHITSNPELNFIEVVSEEELLQRSDIISLHCALTPANAGFMNKENFARMKSGAVLINVSRGGLVNEADLAAALVSGRLGGAGIDVTCTEPLEADSPLRQAPNILITPHMSWYSVESANDLKRKCAEEAVRAVRGEKLRCPVNKL